MPPVRGDRVSAQRFKTRTRKVACPACDGETVALTGQEPALCARCVGAEIAAAPGGDRVLAWNQAIFAMHASRSRTGS